MPLSDNISDTVMDDLKGDQFALGEILEIQGAYDDDICIEEGLHNIGGKQLREPTVRPADFVEGEYGTI